MERLFESIFDNSGIGIALVDKDGKIFKANRFFCDFLSYQDDELIGKNFTDITHPEDVDIDVHQYQQLVEGKINSYQLEKRYLTKKGQIVWGGLSVSLIRDKDGNPEYGIGMVKDINTKKQFEAEKKRDNARISEQNIKLEKALNTLREIQNASKVGVWEVDLLTGEVYLSEEVLRLYGVPEDYTFSPEEGITFYREDFQPIITQAFNELVEEGKPYDLKLILVSRFGDEVWVRATGYPVYEKDKIIKVRGLFSDIGDEVRVQEEINEAKNKLELSVETGGIGIWTWDLVTNDLEWNTQMFEIFEMKKEDFTGTYESFKSRIHPEDIEKVEKEIQSIIKNKEEFRLKFRIVVPGGKEKYLKGRGSLILNEEGEPLKMIGINFDVSEEFEYEESLHAKAEELQRAVNLLSETQHAAKIGSWEVDLVSMEAFWSDEVYRIHGIENGTPIKVEEGINFYREDYRPVIQGAIDAGIQENKTWDEECVLVTQSGKEIWVRAIGKPVFENDELVGLRGLFMDIDKEKRAVVNLIESNKKLNSLLDEKVLLISEVHHRVKNNLALISSFLQLDQIGMGVKGTEDIVAANIVRIKSIAIIHELVYKQNTFSNIPIAETIKKVLEQSINEASKKEHNVIMHEEANLTFNINQAVPLSLLLSEMVFEVALAHKDEEYLFGEHINVMVKEQSSSEYCLAISDVRFCSFAGDMLSSNGNSFSEILNVLAQQVSASVSYDEKRKTIFITFPNEDRKGSSSTLKV